MEEWKEYKIGDVCKIKRGASPRPIQQFLSNKGMPWVKIADATASNSMFLDGTQEYIIEEGVSKSVTVLPGTLIVSNSATPGLPKVIRIKACVHDGWLVISDFKGVLRDFMYYKFVDIRRNLSNQANGSVFQNLKTDIVRDYSINIPSLKTQEKIVSILKSLDDKIEVNRKINENLEQQAQVLFKSWFVDFEPFKNGEFVESELGMIPKGWRVGVLGDVCKGILGGTPSRNKEEYWNGNIAWINSGEVNEFRIVKPSEYITEEGLKHSATKLLPKKTTVLAITGATLGQVSLLEIDSCANQSVIGVLENDNIPYEFIYPLINVKITELCSHMTGGAQQHINKNNVEQLNIVLPSENVMAEYKEKTKSIYSQITNCCFESRRLAELRDTLLPKLMSGELKVNEIEK
jgi:type I restriction enzyme S subunit